MIAAWLLYTVAASALMFGCAFALDYIARATGLPTRFGWIAACVATIALSAAALVGPRVATVDTSALRAATAARVAQESHATWTSSSGPATRRVESFLIDVGGGDARAFVRRINVVQLDRWNSALGSFSAAAGLCALFVLLGAMRRVRRIERECEAGVVDGESVLFSEHLGPAVIGLLRTHIVLPRWVLELPYDDRRTILAHEREHAAAFDPAVLFCAAICVALQPWNIALWAMFARLRLALETDCDRRVLGRAGDVRAYGALLLRVFERATVASAPLLAFVERRSSFEIRVRRLTGARPRLASALGFVATLGLLASMTAASALPRPTRSSVQQFTARIATPVVRWEQTFAPEQKKQRAAPASLAVAPSTLPTTEVTSPRMTTPPAQITLTQSPNTSSRPELVAPSQVTLPRGRPCEEMRQTGHAPCATDATIVIRVLDSTRVLIALRDSSDARANTTVDELFLVTSLRAVALAAYQLIRAGHIEIHEGSLYVVDLANPSTSIAVGPVHLTRLSQPTRPAAVRIDHPSAIAHYYNGSGVFTLEEISGLRTETACQGPAGSCFGVNGKSLRFPQ